MALRPEFTRPQQSGYPCLSSAVIFCYIGSIWSDRPTLLILWVFFRLSTYPISIPSLPWPEAPLLSVVPLPVEPLWPAEFPWPDVLPPYWAWATPATLNIAMLAKAKKDDVENNFMAVPSCLSSNIAVFKRLRTVSQCFSAVTHQKHSPFHDNRVLHDTRYGRKPVRQFNANAFTDNIGKSRGNCSLPSAVWMCHGDTGRRIPNVQYALYYSLHSHSSNRWACGQPGVPRQGHIYTDYAIQYRKDKETKQNGVIQLNSQRNR